jgi:ATP-dependent DNA ligase
MDVRGEVGRLPFVGGEAGPAVELLSRNLKYATAQYPSVARTVAQVHGDAVLLDEEIVALD